MRRLLAVLAMVSVCAAASAQRPARRPRLTRNAQSAEMAVKSAIEELGNDKKAVERDLQVLALVRGADAALADPMQPSVAIQKAFEQIEQAEGLNDDFLITQGLIRTRQRLDEARRSPAAADLGHLRTLLRDDALLPASRMAVRNALRMQEDTAAWIAVQELITSHIRTLSEITGASLRASAEEK